MLSDKLEFDYDHDGVIIHCWAIFEPADESVNIHGGWFVDMAVMKIHDDHTAFVHREEIEKALGLTVVHAMDEAAHAVAEEMKADDEEAYANDLDESLED